MKNQGSFLITKESLGTAMFKELPLDLQADIVFNFGVFWIFFQL